jgi:hypothetical protein
VESSIAATPDTWDLAHYSLFFWLVVQSWCHYQFRTKPVSLTRFRRFLRVFPPLDRCSHTFSSYDMDELMIRRVLVIRTLQKPRCQSSTAWRHGGYMITEWLETIKLSRSAKPGEWWLTLPCLALPSMLAWFGCRLATTTTTIDLSSSPLTVLLSLPTREVSAYCISTLS